MTEALRGTGAPLAYLGAMVVLFLSMKAIPRVRLIARGRVLAAVALLLALGGAVLELGTRHLGAFTPAFLGGAVLGAVFASGATTRTSAAGLAWIPGACGAAVALAAWVAVGTVYGQVRVVAAWLSMLLGTAAAVGGLVSIRGSSSTSATAQATLVVALVGWATAGLGLAVENVMLLVGGGVLGTAGIAFGRVVAGAAGRSLGATVFGGEAPDPFGYTNVRSCGTEEVAAVLETAQTVVIVPGYGMAAAGAQHTVKETAELLERRGVRVRYAIHPSAGVVPGHMNIALDEANVPHDRLIDLEEARALIPQADVVLVVGANDVVNAAASADPTSPLHGLDALDLSGARAVFVVKRSLRPGAGGVKNPLFDRQNTMVVQGHAKKVVQGLLLELKGGGH